MWFVYALSGAFFKSLSGYYRKIAHNIPSSVFSWLTSLIYLIVLLPFVIVFKLPVLSMVLSHPFLVCLLAVTSCVAFMLNVTALKKEELSFVAPLSGFVPILGLIAGWIFVGEKPFIFGVICVFIIFLGTYIMALDSSKVRWYDPLKRLLTSRAAQLSFGVAVLYALNTIFTKEALNLGYDAVSIMFVTDMFGIVIMSYIFATKQRKHVWPSVRSQPLAIIGTTISSIAGSFLHILAVASTFASYALAIRRFDTIFSVLFGWKFLKETNIRNKLIGATIITIGAGLLALSH